MLDLSGYRLTFDDEFSTLSVSATGSGTVWADTRPLSILRPGVDIGFGQSAFVDPSTGIQPFSVSQGAVQITAAPATGATAASVSPSLYTSGLLQSSQSFSQAYGYFEMRAELPAEPGTWPGFWLLAANGHWPPELDVVEAYGANPTALANSVHTGVAGGDTFGQVWTDQPTLTSGFHTFGALWTPQTVTFTYDGNAVGSLATPADMQSAMYPVVALAMSRDVPGITGHPNSMLVDYVRVFSSDASAHAVGLGTVSSPDGVTTADLHGATSATSASAPAATGPTATPAAPATGGTATGSLTLHLSADLWNGGPTFTVSVDGHQVGGVHEVTADHASGARQDVSVTGDFAAGAHTVSITFLNDDHGTPTYDPATGWHMNDRNLYVGGISADGAEFGVGSVTSNTASSGCDWLDPHAAVMVADGTATFAVQTGSAQSPATSATSTAIPAVTQTPVAQASAAAAATGSDTLSFRVSGDLWQGGPRFTVSVDGHQLDGTHEVTASHGAGAWQDVAVTGAFGAGTHTVAVSFVNDDHGTPTYDPATGWQMNDRNLYVSGVALNGHAYDVAAMVANTASGGCDWLDPHAAVMVANGTASFLLS